MWSRTAALAAAVSLFIAAAPTSSRTRAARTPTASRAPSRARTRTPPKRPAPQLPCGDYLGFQVLLDRQGFSPGAIDGQPGDNFTHAIAALQRARNLPATGEADCDTWHALAGDHADPVIATYTITDADIDAEYEPRIPRDIAQQAALESLAYRSPLEMISERFHTTPAMLSYLNPNIQIEAGRQISVPNVQPFDFDAKPQTDPMARDLTIEVTKADSALRVLRPDGSLVFFAPVTTGSDHDPLPIGDWKVLGQRWHPTFHYNPKLFWDAKATDDRATVKPGPNNPVGIVWIAISKDHYGLHGTPDPSAVGHSQSHGCVRLTNWDAARLAALVAPGTAVRFR